VEYTIQLNKSIYNAHMVSQRAESEVRAVTRGKMARHVSKKRHGKNNIIQSSTAPFSASTLLVGHQEEHPLE